ncbi:hypothetical protein MPNT_220016 [Candidatus Methylacidithermus pantelleriae]|uniref:Uncharacterized protein n=1 Tax=Candidatus Methylacidithermus pantelleriae TaxID=2744239 RepID=A0A8J2BIE9_9BACT|nr:hypothetical protein MPNT_220016 [Candidatus Methylacidithermus pantelleriae]
MRLVTARVLRRARQPADARRGLGLSTRVSALEAVVPTPNSGHVIFSDRKQSDGACMVISMVEGRWRLKRAHAAHARSGGNRLPPRLRRPKTGHWALSGLCR